MNEQLSVKEIFAKNIEEAIEKSNSQREDILWMIEHLAVLRATARKKFIPRSENNHYSEGRVFEINEEFQLELEQQKGWASVILCILADPLKYQENLSMAANFRSYFNLISSNEKLQKKFIGCIRPEAILVNSLTEIVNVPFSVFFNTPEI